MCVLEGVLVLLQMFARGNPTKRQGTGTLKVAFDAKALAVPSNDPTTGLLAVCEALRAIEPYVRLDSEAQLLHAVHDGLVPNVCIARARSCDHPCRIEFELLVAGWPNSWALQGWREIMVAFKNKRPLPALAPVQQDDAGDDDLPSDAKFGGSRGSRLPGEDYEGYGVDPAGAGEGEGSDGDGGDGDGAPGFPALESNFESAVQSNFESAVQIWVGR